RMAAWRPPAAVRTPADARLPHRPASPGPAMAAGPLGALLGPPPPTPLLPRARPARGAVAARGAGGRRDGRPRLAAVFRGPRDAGAARLPLGRGPRPVPPGHARLHLRAGAVPGPGGAARPVPPARHTGRPRALARGQPVPCPLPAGDARRPPRLPGGLAT